MRSPAAYRARGAAPPDARPRRSLPGRPTGSDHRDGREPSEKLPVQRTGWGKSLVYLIATKILREQGLGSTLLISPLLSLMRNQVEAAERIGIRAARMDSDTVDAWDEIEARLAGDQIDVLLVSPAAPGHVESRAACAGARQTDTIALT